VSFGGRRFADEPYSQACPRSLVGAALRGLDAFEPLPRIRLALTTGALVAVVLVGLGDNTAVGQAPPGGEATDEEGRATVPFGEPGAEREAFAPPAETQPDPRRILSLERALAHVALLPDPVEAVDVARGMTTALFELTCGIGLLLPPAGERLSLTDGLLGAGCLAASIGLFVASGLRLARLADRGSARARWRRFQRAAQKETLDQADLRRFERSLFADEAATRRTRAAGVALGIAALVVSAVVGGLTAAGEVEARVGTVTSAGTFVVGGLGLVLLALESPAERAATVHRRLGLKRAGDSEAEGAVGGVAE